MIGAGIVGSGCAWWLRRRGHRVTLLDGGEPATSAALGVLMADVFHRSSGRGWRLRQRSLTLWQRWRQELAGRGRPIPHRPGLLRVAGSDGEAERLAALALQRRRQGLPLEFWGPERLAALHPSLPEPT
ncbi:MAG: FAD-dependent oxidoreductase, partial [Synechococcaceae cyanobacterium]|nr:FAD-dependent oxidoreductase [Synechococcaceae cyanobacterium]